MDHFVYLPLDSAEKLQSLKLPDFAFIVRSHSCGGH